MEPVIARLRDMGFDFVAFTSGTASAWRTCWGGVKGSDVNPARCAQGIVALEQKAGRHEPSPNATRCRAWTRAADHLTGAIILRTVLDLCGAEQAVLCETAARGESVPSAGTAPGSWQEFPDLRGASYGLARRCHFTRRTPQARLGGHLSTRPSLARAGGGRRRSCWIRVLL